MEQSKTTKCFWPWSHQWAKWKDVGSGEIGFGSFSTQPVLLQERECECCGKKERHYVKFQSAA